MNEYYGYQQNDYRNYLMHYGKGQKAKNHKYIDIVNGRYIYPEDNQKKVNSGYQVRAKQINAYLAKENGDNSVLVGGKSVGAKKESPFKKNVRKSQKLKNNSLYESHKQLIKGNLEPRRDHTKAKAKSLISNSKTSRFDSLLNKFKSSKSKVSKTLDTSLQKTKYSLSRAKKTLSGAVGRFIQKVKNKRNLEKARDDINQRVFSKYDNYATLGTTPKSGFTFRSSNGKTVVRAYDADDYKSRRRSFFNKFGRKNTKKWKPSTKSNKEG